MDVFTAVLRHAERMPPAVRATALRVLRERIDWSGPDDEIEHAIAWLDEAGPAYLARNLGAVSARVVARREAQ